MGSESAQEFQGYQGGSRPEECLPKLVTSMQAKFVASAVSIYNKGDLNKCTRNSLDGSKKKARSGSKTKDKEKEAGVA
jgi:hypothetical protein